MSPRRLALRFVPALPLAPVLLALAACSDGHDGSNDTGDGASAPLGFELAFAGASAAGGSDDSVAAGAGDAAVPAAPQVIDVAPADLAARIAAGSVRLIDVRTDAEVADGVIPGAEHIPLDRFDPAALGPDDGREVVLYCRSGRRSAVAAEKLAAATGQPAQHLAGGILAWEAAGEPVEAPR